MKKNKTEGPLLTALNEGGSHEENKYGGIPLGEKNRAEEGEAIVKGERPGEGYVLTNSPDSKLTDADIERYYLPKDLKGLTPADAGIKLNEMLAENPGDNILKRTIERTNDSLMLFNEAFKAEKEQAMLNMQKAMDTGTQEQAVDPNQVETQEPQQFFLGGAMNSLGSIGGTAAGTAIGGPIGGKIGGVLGGAVMGLATDYIGGLMNKDNVSEVEKAAANNYTSQFDETGYHRNGGKLNYYEKGGDLNSLNTFENRYGNIDKENITNPYGYEYDPNLDMSYNPSEYKDIFDATKDIFATPNNSINTTDPGKYSDFDPGRVLGRNTDMYDGLNTTQGYNQETNYNLSTDKTVVPSGGEDYGQSDYVASNEAIYGKKDKPFKAKGESPWMYAGAIGSGLAYLKDRKQDPYVEKYNTLGNTYDVDKVNENQLVNISGQSLNNQIKALAESGMINPANMLATQTNYNKNISDAFLKAEDYNRGIDKEREQFELNRDNINLGQINKQTEANAANWAANKDMKERSRDRFIDNLAGIGLEKTRKNQIYNATGGYNSQGQFNKEAFDFLKTSGWSEDEIVNGKKKTKNKE